MQSEIFCLCTEQGFNKGIAKELPNSLFWRFLGRTWGFLRISIVTEDGRVFKAKLEKDIKKEIVDKVKSTNKNT